MISRKGIAVLAGVIALGALASKPWELAERTIERFLLASLSTQISAQITTGRPGGVALLPWPRISANDLFVSFGGGEITARIPRLRADIKLLPLVAGRLEFDQLTLVSPQIEVVLPSGQFEPLQALASHALSQLAPFPRVTVGGNGSVFLRRDGIIVSSIRDITINTAEHITGEAVQTSGSLVWRGEKLDFAFASNSANRTTLPMLRVRSDLLSLDFTSTRTPPNTPAPSLDGQITLAARSTSRLGSWLATSSPVLLPIGNAAITGRLRLADDGAQVSNAVVTLGSDTLDGALDWRRREGRWRLTGTLAGRNLDIGRPQAGIDVQRLAVPEPSSTAPIDIDDLLAHDIDLRVSLQRVRLPGLSFSEVAAQIMATEQRLDLAVANAALYGGVLRGRGSISRSTNGIEVRSQMTAERVDLAQLSQELFEARRLTGSGLLQQTLETSGRTASELVMNAQGRLALTVRNGDFMGTNLNDAMRRIERQPLSVARDWRGGRTAFESMAITGTLVGGSFEVSEARGNGPSFRMAMDGQISLIERMFKLNGYVRSATGAASIPFEVVGPLTQPSVNVNARAFLERSGAAAPLAPQQAN